ncbi:MAG TPA: hypothetical protein PKY81_07880 [bacterium]|nr:hypothetical protein [bacterium]HPN30862.1 hypothetical protein [bacterium]
MNKQLLSVFTILILFFFNNNLSAESTADTGSASGTNIIYTFNGEDEIKEFAQLAQMKMAVINKMSVLENYIVLEKNNLDEVNGQLLLKYKIDPVKNYSLDANTKKIFENSPDVSNSEKKTEKSVYDFASDDDMKNFVNMIQVKQSVLNRITILQEYLISEKNNFDRVNGQLILKFKIDPAKNYSLDSEKKVIIENK